MIQKMSDAQERHLQSVKEEFSSLVDMKYRKGQAEHGGDLFLKGGMVKMIQDEIVDLPVYFFTLKEQLRRVLTLLREGKGENALNLLEVIVEGKGDK